MKLFSTSSVLKKAKTKQRIEIEGDLLKQLQKTLLEILKDVVYVCDKYNLYYSLSGGSALGAVRHKGFIPWDDDIDIFMRREDYDKFRLIFNKELGSKYSLRSLETTPEDGFPVVQIVKKGTIYKTSLTPSSNNCGVYIDIHVLENAPNNIFFRYIHGIVSLILGFILSCSRFYKNRKYLLDIYSEADTKTIGLIKQKIKIGFIFSFLKLDTWGKLYINWCKIYKNKESKYVVYPSAIKHYFNAVFLREEYCKTKNIQFEDMQVKVIRNVEKALENLYGDFGEIPDEENREKHFVFEIKL